MHCYFDVGDVLAHFARHRAPSGVQRVVLSVLEELRRDATMRQRLRLVRIHRRGVVEVAHDALPRLDQAPDSAQQRAPGPGLAVRVVKRLPPALQGPLRRGYYAARLAASRIACTVLGTRDRLPDASAGDWLVVMGAGWSGMDHAWHLTRVARQHRLRLALLVHDLIPSVRPRWHGVGARGFERWLAMMLSQAERVATVSQHTRSDLVAFAKRRGLNLPSETITTLRLGEELPAGATPRPVPGLAPPFALCVGTLETRKNQRLLVEIWQRLAQRHTTTTSAKALPRLVLAGRLGVGGNEVLRMLEQCGWLDGRVLWLSQLDDAELAWAYRHADFTLVPSRYEGWGLPVAESLAHQTPCIAAEATSLTEVGAGYAEFVPLDDVEAWMRKVEQFAFDEQAARTTARDRLRERPVRTWAETARDVTNWLA